MLRVTFTGNAYDLWPGDLDALGRGVDAAIREATDEIIGLMIQYIDRTYRTETFEGDSKPMIYTGRTGASIRKTTRGYRTGSGTYFATVQINDPAAQELAEGRTTSTEGELVTWARVKLGLPPKRAKAFAASVLETGQVNTKDLIGKALLYNYQFTQEANDIVVRNLSRVLSERYSGAFR